MCMSCDNDALAQGCYGLGGLDIRALIVIWVKTLCAYAISYKLFANMVVFVKSSILHLLIICISICELQLIN